MKPEGRILEELQAYAVDLERSTPAISADHVHAAIESQRRPPRRHPWQFVVAGFAVALAISLVVLLLNGTLAREDQTDVTTGPVAGPPKRILVLTTDGRLVVVRSQDGREVRVVEEGIPVGVGEGQSLQVAPDGSSAYFLQTTNSTCAGAPIPELVRANLESGAIEGIATSVRWPALSPNGRLLAFTGVPNCSDAGGSIFVLDTETGETSEFMTEAWQVRAGIGYLSWAPDSRHLLYAPFDAPEGSFPRVLDTNDSAPLDANQPILNPDGSRVDGYLGSTGQLLGTRAPSSNEPQKLGVVTFDSVSGEITRRLFRLSEPCCGQTVTSDATGRHVLAVGVFPSSLYSWSDGDRKPQEIADEIVAATWFPDEAGRVEIRVLPSLRFDQEQYMTESGVLEITYLSEGGAHVLVFRDEELAGLRLVVQGLDSDVARVRLEPGSYTIFCDIPGHRQAGEEATITAVSASPK